MNTVATKAPIKATKLGNAILRSNLKELYHETDRLFVYLLFIQWALAIGIAGLISPFNWIGRERFINFHLESAVLVGAILTIFPVWLLRKHSGEKVTRYVVVISQACWSPLLIHLSGGRVETHFHIFGSLAFIAFYRDWKLLIPASIIAMITHLSLGPQFAQSMYGVDKVEWWRFIEHSAWVTFEDVFLCIACVRSHREMMVAAERQAELQSMQDAIFVEIEVKTAALVEASNQREKLQVELLQSHKLESVGRLASGIAHEINSPIQYVSDSVFFAKDGLTELMATIDKLESADEIDLPIEQREVVLEWIHKVIQDSDIAYLRDNLPKALERSTDGLNRVTEIVRSMKSFAHPDQREMIDTDLNEAIRTTLVVCRNEYKYIAKVETNFGNLPMVTCHAGEINQVLINLIINSAHAISDQLIDPSAMGTIVIETKVDGDHVVIQVRDNGCGIPQENVDRIFEPFFTTKGVGRGTGQGLAVVHGIIVNKLGGSIAIESTVGEGTMFSMRIPIKQFSLEEAA